MCKTASCLEERLEGIDLVSHRGPEIGIVPSVDEQDADRGQGNEGHDQGQHHRSIDPGLVVVLLGLDRTVPPQEGEERKAGEEEQGQEQEGDKIEESLGCLPRNQDHVFI